MMLTEKQEARMLASARNNGVIASNVIDLETGCMCLIGHAYSAKRGRRLSRDKTYDYNDMIRLLDETGDGSLSHVFTPNDQYVDNLTYARRQNLRKGDPAEVLAWSQEMKDRGAYKVRTN